jgi:hypothetical protein
VSACGTLGGANSAGQWVAAPDSGVVGNKYVVTLLLSETTDQLSGSGAIVAGFVPGWAGDEFTITSGTFSDVALSFTAQLGATPDGNGGFNRGTLTFTGQFLSPTSVFGDLTFTPPASATQTFVTERLPGITFVRF